MDQYWTEVDGVRRTDVNFDIPPGYTNSFEDMGGPGIWGEGGLIFHEALKYSMEYNSVKPLFSSDTEPVWFFEVPGRGVYIFDVGRQLLFRIMEPEDVESIVERLSQGSPYEECLAVERADVTG